MERVEPEPVKKVDLTNLTIVMYHSPICRRCEKYEEYLESAGFEVESIEIEKTGSLKKEMGILKKMWSCHTIVIGDYYVEGHVPVEAIRKLLEEQPDIDGIALPDMPSGSPGMDGVKKKPFTIYAISDGEVKVFMEI